MKSLLLKLPAGRGPLYLRIAEAVRRAVGTGQLRPGEALPSTRVLARDLRTNRHTVMAAFGELAAEGWLTVEPRFPVRVSATLPSRFFEPQKTATLPARRPHRWRITRRPQLEPLASSRYPFKWNFVVGPDLRLFPFEDFRSHLADALKRSGPRLFDYGDPLGQPSLVEELGVFLRRTRAIKDRRIIITHGSQEAIFLASQVLLKAGDWVGVEEMGYHPAFEALKSAGAKLAPLRIDSEGLDPDHLAFTLRRKKLRLLYMTPLHQYPTTVTLPIARRMRIYELAARYRVPILEDDYDHEYHYRCNPMTPFAADDTDGLVIYISTFSKVFSPSARIGFMAVPPALAQPFAAFRRIVTRQNDYLLQDAVARWMRDGSFERHLRRTRRIYEERRDAMLASLERGRELGLNWQKPDGGMALWLETGRDSKTAAALAEKRGVYTSPESEYQLKRGRATHLRLGFAQQSPPEIRAGIDVLLKVLSEQPLKSKAS